MVLELLAAAAAAVAPTRARGDFSATAEPGYAVGETVTSDRAGTTTREESQTLTQRYRLSLDRPLTSALSLGLAGSLLDERAWTRGAGSWSFERAQSTFGAARLNLAAPGLSGGLGADRREQQSFGATPAVIAESYGGNLTWRPIELPELDLRVSRVDSYDRTRSLQDATTDTAQLGARYKAAQYDVRYLLGWTRSADHLHALQTTALEQAVFATRTETLLGGRFSTYLSGSAQARNTTTSSRDGSGLVPRQQLPVAGLTGIVTLPATSEAVTLSPNPAVVDGSLTAGASVNVGFGPAVLGDRSPREVGATFADTLTPVNRLYVWLDRAPAGSVGTTLAASVQVYQSGDNRTWVEVIGATATPSRFENRLEVSIPQLVARHVKVKLVPLPVGVTTDAAYRDLAVTELQLVLVRPASEVIGQQRSVTTTATALTRALLLRDPEVAHDLSASVSRHSEGSLTTYSVVNGLSAARDLRQRLALNARLARQDADVGQGHEAGWEWSAGLVGRPIPAAHWSVSYSGSQSARAGLAHSLGGLGRADWYDGVSSQATAVASRRYQGGTTSTAADVGGSTSLTPNRVVTVTGGAQYSRTWKETPGVPLIWTQFLRAFGSVSLTPAPALSGAATVARVLIGERPTTLASVQLNLSPLRGEVQLSASYAKTLDTEAQATSEVFTPSLRWNVRQRVTLTTSYTYLRSVAPVQVLTTRVLAANLLVSL